MSDAPSNSNDHAFISDAHRQFQASLGPAAQLARAIAQPIAPGIGNVLPGYDILDEVHRGGQGVVYRARQRSTQRAVAIKVIRAWPIVSRSDAARFEREVGILAQLDHPNIVRIIDRGTADGHGYFVMDYIEGMALDAWVAARSAAAAHGRARAPAAVEPPHPACVPSNAVLGDVLAMFVKICDAIHAAHVRGVIHRDLKPGNIQVDPRDEPHILDFGLAKRIDDHSSAGLTQSDGRFLGSLYWASPEQARGTPADADIRSDVYSLGVMLYRLITGRFPYDVEGSWGQALEAILHAEPMRPSHAAARTGRRRRARRSGTSGVTLSNDLETILLKCLNKDPQRRYQTAGALGADLQRLLAGAPIDARGDSLGYVLRTHLRRHRVAVGVGVSFVLLIAVGLVATTTLWRRAVSDRNQAREAQTRAQLRLQQAQAVTDLLQSMLSSADPMVLGGRNYTVREMLDEFDARLGRTLTAHPQVEAAVRSTVGNAYRHLAELDKAESHLRAALVVHRAQADAAPTDIAQALIDLAQLQRDRGDIAAAEAALRESLDLLPADGDVAQRVRALALNVWGEIVAQRGDIDQAESLLSASLDAASRAGDGSVALQASGLHYLGRLAAERRQFDRADQHFEGAVAAYTRVYGPEHPDLATTLNDWGNMLIERGLLEVAEEKITSALYIVERCYGPDHVHVANVLLALATVAKGRDDLQEAEALQRRALALREQAFGPDHPSLAVCLNDLGVVLMTGGDASGAVTCLQHALRIERHHFPTPRPETAVTLNNLANALFGAQDHAAAEDAIREALDINRNAFSAVHPAVLDDLRGLSWILEARGNVAEAIDTLRELLGAYDETRLADDPGTRASRLRLAGLLARHGVAELDRGLAAEADALFSECLTLRRALLPIGDWQVASAASLLGAARIASGRQAEALPLLEEAWSTLSTPTTAPPEVVAATIERLARCCADLGNTQRADALRARAGRVRAATPDP